MDIDITIVSSLAVWIGIIISLLIWWYGKRIELVLELLDEGQKIYSLREAWIQIGEFQEGDTLKNIANKSKDDDKTWKREFLLDKSSGEPYLLKVELRTILDEGTWKVPENPKETFYDWINGRRTWIVRNEFSDKGPGGSFPAIISSKAQIDILIWLEKVSIAQMYFLLKKDIRQLSPILCPILRTDRVKFWNIDQDKRLNKLYKKFSKYRKKWCIFGI